MSDLHWRSMLDVPKDGVWLLLCYSDASGVVPARWLDLEDAAEDGPGFYGPDGEWHDGDGFAGWIPAPPTKGWNLHY